jgi:hypothetical protein
MVLNRTSSGHRGALNKISIIGELNCAWAFADNDDMASQPVAY